MSPLYIWGCLLAFQIVNTSALFHIRPKKPVIRATEDILVQTEYGLVRGMRNDTIEQKKTYYAFKGIPYAEPPLGDLRFEPPTAPKPWNTLDATQEKSMCVQNALPVQGNEDCLYLNIYTPQILNSSLPVMVWIYGGGFIFGNAWYNTTAPDYFLEQNVVIVMISYRVGIFGFISTNDLVAPGNGGLKDQNFAIKWVQRNIANFGGNPNSITLFGGSAGSASVSYHLQSKLSQGLFQRAIMQSGTSVCLWSLSRLIKRQTFQIGQTLNLNTSTSASLIAGLKQVDYTTLQTVSTLVYFAITAEKWLQSGLIIAPVIEPEHEGAFFTTKSHESFRNGQFYKIPTIMGYNSFEGGIFQNSPLALYYERYDLNPSDLVPIDMNIVNEATKREVGLKIRNHYYGILPIFINSTNTARFFSEDQFNRPIHEALRLQSQYVPTYCYRFSYEGGLGGVDHSTTHGVRHTEEEAYMWIKNLELGQVTSTDKLTRNRFLRLWTNFAKFGVPTPTPDQLLENIIWPTYNVGNNLNATCLDIGSSLKIVQNPDNEGIKFFRQLYGQYGIPPYDTY